MVAYELQISFPLTSAQSNYFPSQILYSDPLRRFCWPRGLLWWSLLCSHSVVSLEDLQCGAWKEEAVFFPALLERSVVQGSKLSMRFPYQCTRFLLVIFFLRDILCFTENPLEWKYPLPASKNAQVWHVEVFIEIPSFLCEVTPLFKLKNAFHFGP